MIVDMFLFHSSISICEYPECVSRFTYIPRSLDESRHSLTLYIVCAISSITTFSFLSSIQTCRKAPLAENTVDEAQ